MDGKTKAGEKPVFAFVLCLLSFVLSAAAAPEFAITPYLQRPSSDAMSIIFFTTEQCAATVTCGSQTTNTVGVWAEALTNNAYQVGKGVEKNTWKNSLYRHRVRFEGLKANTSYDYTVTLGGATYSNTFRTAPDRDTPIRFVSYADCETTSGHFDKYTANLKRMKARDPDLITSAGDLVARGGIQSYWDEFWMQNAGGNGIGYTDILGSIPMITAIGNHDLFDNVSHSSSSFYHDAQGEFATEKFLSYFEFNSNNVPYTVCDGTNIPETRDMSQLFHREDYGPVTLIFLDSNNGQDGDTDADHARDSNWCKSTNTNHQPGGMDRREGARHPDFNPETPQYTWLTNNLADAQQKSRFTFVFNHHCPYSRGQHNRPPNTSADEDASAVPLRILTETMVRYGVDGWYCGHDELLEHSITNGWEILPNGSRRKHTLSIYDLGGSGDNDTRTTGSVSNPLEYRFMGNYGKGDYGFLETDVTTNKLGQWTCTITPVQGASGDYVANSQIVYVENPNRGEDENDLVYAEYATTKPIEGVSSTKPSDWLPLGRSSGTVDPPVEPPDDPDDPGDDDEGAEWQSSYTIQEGETTDVIWCEYIKESKVQTRWWKFDGGEASIATPAFVDANPNEPRMSGSPTERAKFTFTGVKAGSTTWTAYTYTDGGQQKANTYPGYDKANPAADGETYDSNSWSTGSKVSITITVTAKQQPDDPVDPPDDPPASGVATNIYRGCAVMSTGAECVPLADSDDLVLRFTESGTLVVTNGFTADILVVGGGGAGVMAKSSSSNKYNGNGGNGGSASEVSDRSLPAGTYAITVGAGAKGVTTKVRDFTGGSDAEESSIAAGAGVSEFETISAEGGTAWATMDSSISSTQSGTKSSSGKVADSGTGAELMSAIAGESSVYGRPGIPPPSDQVRNTFDGADADEYGEGGQGSANGGSSGAGANGVVIVRIRAVGTPPVDPPVDPPDDPDEPPGDPSAGSDDPVTIDVLAAGTSTNFVTASKATNWTVDTDEKKNYSVDIERNDDGMATVTITGNYGAVSDYTITVKGDGKAVKVITLRKIGPKEEWIELAEGGSFERTCDFHTAKTWALDAPNAHTTAKISSTASATSTKLTVTADRQSPGTDVITVQRVATDKSKVDMYVYYVTVTGGGTPPVDPPDDPDDPPDDPSAGSDDDVTVDVLAAGTVTNFITATAADLWNCKSSSSCVGAGIVRNGDGTATVTITGFYARVSSTTVKVYCGSETAGSGTLVRTVTIGRVDPKERDVELAPDGTFTDTCAYTSSKKWKLDTLPACASATVGESGASVALEITGAAVGSGTVTVLCNAGMNGAYIPMYVYHVTVTSGGEPPVDPPDPPPDLTPYERLCVAALAGEAYEFTEDIEFPENGVLTVPVGAEFVLDLKGRAITCHADGAIVNNGKLTIIDSAKAGPLQAHIAYSAAEQGTGQTLIRNAGELVIDGVFVDAGVVDGANSVFGGGNTAIAATAGSVTVKNGAHVGGQTAIAATGDVAVIADGAHVMGWRGAAVVLAGVSSTLSVSNSTLEAEGQIVRASAGAATIVDSTLASSYTTAPFDLGSGAAVTIEKSIYVDRMARWFPVTTALANDGADLKVGAGCLLAVASESVIGFLDDGVTAGEVAPRVWRTKGADDEALPPLTDEEKSRIAEILASSPDRLLAKNITEVKDYMAYRAWVDKGVEAGTIDSQAAAKGSEGSFFSFATDQNRIVDPAEITEEKVKVEEVKVNGGEVTLTVGIDGVPVGENAQAAYLEKVFGVTGTAALDEEFATEKVTYGNMRNNGDGTVSYSAEPKVAEGEPKPDAFFFKAKVETGK